MHGVTRLAAVAALTALIACHTSAPGATDVRIALSRDGITWLPVHLAHALGYDHEEGLEFVLSEVGGMSKGVEALMGGSVDVTAGALAQTIQAASEGAAMRCFLNLYTRPILAIAVAPGMTQTIRDVRDLKGHSVGVSAPGSATHQFLNALLFAGGLSPDDVSAVPVGTAATSISALEHGKVDAAVLVGSAIPMVKQRNAAIVFLADTRTPEGARMVFGTDTFSNTSMVARDRWLNQSGDVPRRFVRAIKKGMDWMRHQPAEQVRTKMPEDLRMPDAAADVSAIRDAQRVLSADGAIPVGAPEQVLKYVSLSSAKVRGATIDLSQLYTTNSSRTTDD
jgi:NitT/TauT family transport system substrate-binding protein